MAIRNGFNIALCGENSYRHTARLERTLKKFSPPLFNSITGATLDQERQKAVEERLRMSMKDDRFPLELPDRFTGLITQALCAFEANTHAHCALALWSGYDLANSRRSDSVVGARALLIESTKVDLWDGSPHGLHGFRAEICIPFVSQPLPAPGERSDTQIDRCIATVIHGVIEGWRYESTRYNGVLRKLNYHP